MPILVDLPLSGPDGSTTLVDNTGRPWTAQGNARLQDNALLISAFGDNARTPGDSLNLVYSGGPSTVQVDVKTTSTANEQIVLDYYMSGTGLRWQITIYGGKMHVYNSSNGRFMTGTITVNDGVWHTLRMEKSGPTTRIFVDGVADGVSNTTAVADSAAPYLTIGTENSSSTQFIGSVRNLKIEVPDPALALTHRPYPRVSYIGWDKSINADRVKSWYVHRNPVNVTKKVQVFKITRGVPPWWGPSGSTAQLPTYKIRGRVMQRDPDTLEDTPVQNVRVALFFRRLHTLVDIQLSDADGYVQFDNLMPGVQAYYGIAIDSDNAPMQNSIIWDRLSSEPGP